ncbi:MAG: rod shape-determining protein RodA [Gammaproteobacteria bacterium]
MTNIRFDTVLLVTLLTLVIIGLAVSYSASGGSIAVVQGQMVRIAIGMVVMLGVAQLPGHFFYRLAPALFIFGLLLLLAVELAGDVGKGAQRWLDLGLIRFQPSELSKLVVPMMVARYLSERGQPLAWRYLGGALFLIALPAALILRQPDLGTALMVVAAGMAVIFFAGISWRVMAAGAALFLAMIPVGWHFMHEYQRVRVLTLLDPSSDPLGAGYHTIQSMIAIGSGGLLGKGWLNGTQAHLDFLPESSTDFIFAVYAEEFGLVGCAVLLLLYMLLLLRGLQISATAGDGFGRLMAGAIVAIFFFYVVVNMGMVAGVLPVVGVPLPLISYGGSSLVTLMLGFGVLMAIRNDRKMWTK